MYVVTSEKCYPGYMTKRKQTFRSGLYNFVQSPTTRMDNIQKYVVPTPREKLLFWLIEILYLNFYFLQIKCNLLNRKVMCNKCVFAYNK